MRLESLERRPWLLALVAGAGITLLVPSALALVLPPELLDVAVAAGDRRLWLALGGLFSVATLITRVSLRRPGRGDEDPAAPSVQPPRGYLR
jgi:hypothetical protein